MEFYFNHNEIQKEMEESQEEHNILEVCKTFIELISELTKQNDSIKISDEWIAALSQNLDYKKYAAFFQCVGQVFMARFKIEISPDTNKTMQMYGNQREVIIHNEKHKMCNHIKIPVQASRIYFKYIDGKIYIGHSGEHLRTANNR